MQLQILLEPARISRDTGINLVAENSGADWQEKAYNALLFFARGADEFMTEDARIYSEAIGLEKPHDNRAWGAVIVRAIKAGIVKRVGYAPSKTGHMRPMPLWVSLINSQEN